MHVYKKYALEITVFASGAVVMMFELVGSRVLGPYFGTSIYVWTSLIGIVLGSLSLGYYIGGRIADKNHSYNDLAKIIFLAAMFIGATIFIKDILLSLLTLSSVDMRVTSVIASLLLFLPASVLLGMVSPYAVKLKLESLSTSGQTVGNLYAISTGGSIFGTFLCGFYLIPYFGTDKLIIILSIVLVVLSIMLAEKGALKNKMPFLVVMIISWPLLDSLSVPFGMSDLIDTDTEYNRVLIYNFTDAQTAKQVKIMGINNENHSSMFLDSDELVNEYTKYYHLARHFNPTFSTTLMIGGAGYSYPKHFLTSYATATIDVIEIDPKMTALAKEHFRLTENPRMTITHEDGRIFLNATKKKYDVIFGDAFSSHYSVPYQLTTKEAVQKKFDILNQNGVVILNIISSVDGVQGKFLRAEYATYKHIFPQVFLFPVSSPKDGKEVQNIILVALKSDSPPSFKSNEVSLNSYLSHLWEGDVADDMPILTDDFAPVDHYMSKTI